MSMVNGQLSVANGGAKDWLAARAGTTPGKLALIAGERRWTYGELDTAVSTAAAHLHTQGVRPGHRVAVHLPNSFLYVSLVHALARLGAVLVPLNTRLTPREAAWQVEAAGARRLISDQELSIVNCERLIVNESRLSDRSSFTIQNSQFKIHNYQAILFTSGTTGRPKGTPLTFANHFWSAMASAYRLGVRPDELWLSVLPLYHVGGLAVLFRSCLYGTAVDLHPRFDVDAINHALDAKPITLISLVPTMLHRLLETRDHWPASLRLILLGGAAAPPALMQRANALPRSVIGDQLSVNSYQLSVIGERLSVSGVPNSQFTIHNSQFPIHNSQFTIPNSQFPIPNSQFPIHNSQFPIHNSQFPIHNSQFTIPNSQFPPLVAPTYGLTEAASQVATMLPAEAARKPGSVGKPLLFTQVRIVDEAGNKMPPGEVGEIVVTGPTVMGGYLNNQQLTANEQWATEAPKSEITNQPSTIHTGDMGYMDAEGDLWIVQRRSDLIVSGGENVYPAEVENVLREHPAVKNACVVGAPDPEWGQRVAAMAAVGTETAVSAADLDQFCRERLAGYKRPRQWQLVSALPLTASGKIARREVAQRMAEDG